MYIFGQNKITKNSLFAFTVTIYMPRLKLKVANKH